MRSVIWITGLAGVLAAGCSEPIPLRTYDRQVLVYPDDVLEPEHPTVLAFLNADDRRCDRLVRPLRALSAQKDVKLVGVLTYEDNSFLQNLTTASDIKFPMMLDPKKRMVGRFGVRRYPTFIYLSPQGKEQDRKYDIKDIRPWYLPQRIRKAKGPKPVDEDLTPEEKVQEDELRT